MKTLILIFAMLSSQAFAADGWLCESESGERQGDTIKACGVGEALQESNARRQALNNALIEFQTICEASTECRERTTMVVPKRLSCTESKDGLWKCFRLIEVTLGKR